MPLRDRRPRSDRDGASFRKIKVHWLNLARRAPWNRLDPLFLDLIYLALDGLTSGISAAISGIAPIAVTLIAVPLFGERITWAKGGALVFGTAGVVVMAIGRSHGGSVAGCAVGTTVCAMMVIAAGNLYVKNYGSEIPRS